MKTTHSYEEVLKNSAQAFANWFAHDTDAQHQEPPCQRIVANYETEKSKSESRATGVRTFNFGKQAVVKGEGKDIILSFVVTMTADVQRNETLMDSLKRKLKSL